MVHLSMKFFGDANDRFHHIWEAAATAATLGQRVIYLGRDDQLPGVCLQQFDDRAFDLLLGDQIAMANDHRPRSTVATRGALAGLDGTPQMRREKTHAIITISRGAG
jgi:hypothetical protein